MSLDSPGPSGVDEWGARRSLNGPESLAPFAAATVLDAADVHLAATLCRLGGLSSDSPDTGGVALAIALACRAVRHGSVTVDLATAAESVTVDDGADIDVSSLPWPEPDAWVAAVAACPLVAVGDDTETDRGTRARPLRLLGTHLALDRYWRHERAIAASIKTRLVGDGADLPVDPARLDALFGSSDLDDRQRQATAAAVDHRFVVIAGGPGTGKTTTIAAVLALLLEPDERVISCQAPDDTLSAWHGPSTPRVALAAPTGKAAARLTEAVHDRARLLAAEGRVDASVADSILAIDASTLHRLLGRKPGSNSRFRHDAANRLPHDVVIVDETSMVSLSMMAHVLAAVRDDAHLILVGDPRQLSSVEAGAVLGDIVAAATPDAPLSPNVVVLERVHRFAGGIGELAAAIVTGDADAALAVLSGGATDVEWIDVDVSTAAGHGAATDAIRAPLVATASAVVEAARDGDAAIALAAMGRAQLLCAHRRGPFGVATWRREVERWLTDEIPGYSPYGWFAGRPLLVTQNDYALELFNGDTGVAIATPGSDALTCAFERRGEIIGVSPSRLRAIETLYAMTIHKSQGSQFDHPVVVLPEETSPILTRELFYTAVTRASDRLTVVGTEASIRAAIERPVQRASGLSRRLA